MSEGIRVEDSGPIRRITLDRPAKKNALTLAMYAMLDKALSEAAALDRTSVVVLGGAGDTFCAGNDIGDFLRASTGAAQGNDPTRPGTFLRTLSSFPKPLICAVHGAAIGIGATMLLHCDRVLASAAATFQFPFAKLGLVPEAGSSVLLPARVGLQRASEWLLWGERIDAETALRCGLVNEVVAPEALERTAAAHAEALATLPLGALRETKRLLREPLRADVDAAMAREMEAFAARLVSPEAAAAFSAFLARGR